MPEHTLILLRHAKSDWSGDEADIDRPLANAADVRRRPSAGGWPRTSMASTSRSSRPPLALAAPGISSRPSSMSCLRCASTTACTPRRTNSCSGSFASFLTPSRPSSWSATTPGSRTWLRFSRASRLRCPPAPSRSSVCRGPGRPRVGIRRCCMRRAGHRLADRSRRFPHATPYRRPLVVLSLPKHGVSVTNGRRLVALLSETNGGVAHQRSPCCPNSDRPGWEGLPCDPCD